MPHQHRPLDAPGLFVTFEGGEGAGKSTQIQRLRRRLAGNRISVLATREPGGSKRAELIRHVLLSGAAKPLGAEGEAILFAAARQDHVATLIAPAIAQGTTVLCDRFIDSSRVYQGVVGSVDETLLRHLEDAAIGTTFPNLTILIDVPPEQGLARARARGQDGHDPDRYEAEGEIFHAAVRRAFLHLAAAEPGRFRIIDGTRSADAVDEAIWAAVRPSFGIDRV